MQLETLSGEPASRLGFASQYLKDSACVPMAFEAGINYFFSYDLSGDPLVDALKPLLVKQRDEILIAAGSESRHPQELQQSLEQGRRSLQIDVIDAFFLEYLSPNDQPDEVAAALTQLKRWKQEGHIRYVGLTTHNRDIALQIIQQKQCDVLMLRYNMAHRKIEWEVLPAAQAAGLPVIAFTCTRWGRLLKGHPQWNHPTPTAADCYRYALHHPAVQIALTAPSSRAQLEENLVALNARPLEPKQIGQWQAYGDLVYGKGQDSFETEWL